MKALKRLTLVLAVGLMAVACGDDDEGNSGGGGGLDGGFKPADGGADGSADGGINVADLPCTSTTPPANGKCGGSHCLQTEAELKASAIAGATCGADAEIKSFCALESVNAVTVCTRENLNKLGNESEFKAAITTCAAEDLPQFSSQCLSCFVDSGNCAAQKCLTECASATSPLCDACRIEKGCIGDFYKCAGLADPLDALR